MSPAVLLLAQLLPRQAVPTADTARDSARLTPQVGRAARRLLSDSVTAAPAQFGHWVSSAYTTGLQLLPRVAVALAVAALVLGLTLWVRAATRRRVASDDGAPAVGAAGLSGRTATSIAARGVQTLGVLVAALLAAWIVGATTLAAAVLTFAVFYAAAIALAVVGARTRARAPAPEAVDLALSVVRYALLVLGAVEALDTLGLNLGGVIAGLGILGLAVGFAAQDAFANLIAGFMILWDRPLRVGDWVRVHGAEGRVRRITLRTTRIETRDEGILVLPNKEVTGATLHNFSLRNRTRVRVPVGVSYATDVDAARATLLALLDGEPAIAPDPPPFVAVTALADSAVTLELVFFVADPRELAPLRWRLFEAILREFRRQRIEIAFPQLDVHLRHPASAG